ncbi:PQQ-binding-like beta-propeller repeat protein [Micromonospora mirobrigensis]|uniref:Outer membrane protein assembly factor BamB, contains PQQ-like beta-propeller repeat n=1 Tax=Micromonospora mirobrigensis TaxID=262898 RepID=A0A1C5A1W8_9ACTN|nr:PQQ-binding-like beta-propeller repeat protein [Micromonospora mirobrigensis]SCF39183.1 Outer membrane protein assembly factor BamB, contains PQQ-like beta-propeller repeat [Micromonospora mirobrigensis]
MTVIDLGELRQEPDEERREPRPPRSVGRPLRLALVLALVVATVAGADAGRVTAPTLVPAPTGAQPFLAADRLYVAEPGTDNQGPRDLVAYPLPRAGRRGPTRPAPLWRTTMPGRGETVGVLELAGVVVVTGPTIGGDTYLTAAFDRATGVLRWQQSGVATSGGRELLVQTGLDEGTTGRVRRVDPDTGRTLWSVPTAPEAVHFGFRDDRVDRLVLVPAEGPVEVWDTGSGRRLRSADLAAGALPRYQGAYVVDDLLVLTPDNSTLVAYGLAGLDRRWQIDLPLVGYLVRCAELVCALGQTGGIRALDPATGRTVWSDPRWQPLDERDGRLLVAEPGPSSVVALRVLDAASGRGVADLGDWELVRRMWRDDPLVGVRRAGEHKVLVADLDLTTGEAGNLDVLVGATGDCQAGPAVLLCGRDDGTFGLWPRRR